MSLFGLATGLATKTAANAAKKAVSNTVKKSSSSGSSSSATKTSGGMAAGLANSAADFYKTAMDTVKSTGAIGSGTSGTTGTTGNKIVRVGADGKAPAGLSVGDSVLTGGGTYRITGFNPDGTYKSEKVSTTTTTTKPVYNYLDSEGNPRSSSDKTDWALMYLNFLNSGQFGAAQTALDQRALKMGGGTDNWQTTAQNQLDAAKNQSYVSDYKSALDSSLSNYESKAQAIRDEQDASVQKNIAALNAQRPLVQQAGAQANQAAQQSYYQTINPNGLGAEQRAALGLSNSGLTETAQIAAANAYQSAVNSNAQNVNSQLAQIDLAIRNAELSGDIATAQQLQSYYDTVLSAGMQNASNVLGAQQWALGNAQDLRQQNIQNAYTQAGITGQYNGQQTLAGQQAALDFRNMDLANQRAALELMIQQRYGLDQAAADLYLTQMQAAGQNYQNIYQNLQNQYAQRMI